MHATFTFALAASLVASASEPAAQLRKTASSLPADIVAAWEKAGGRSGWLGPDENGYLAFRVGNGPRDEEVPAFAFGAWQPGVLGRLPQVEHAFGLSFITNLTEDDMKELAGQKALQSLSLHFTKVSSAALKQLGGCQSLRSLDLNGEEIKDGGMKELARLKSLRWLSLTRTYLTDAGLKELAGLKSLRSLNLRDAKVTDLGLKGVAKVTSLQYLDLTRAQITDAGLKELAALKSLKTLNLTGTSVAGDLRFLVTETGVAELRKALPGVNIFR